VKELLVSGAYTVGFVYVVVGRSLLFTEQTTSAVLPVLARRAGAGALLRLWTLVLAANLVGCAASAALFALLGERLHIVDAAALAGMARKLVEVPAGVTLLSAIAAGWDCSRGSSSPRAAAPRRSCSCSRRRSSSALPAFIIRSRAASRC
jgi:formate/nitrite transporter FocA (FNT family)